MATVAEPLARVQDPPRPGVSPLVEFLLVGGATPVLFAFGWVLRRVVGLDAAELAFGFTFFYAAHLLNGEKEAEASIGEQRGRSGGRSGEESRPNDTLTADVFVHGMRRPS